MTEPGTAVVVAEPVRVELGVIRADTPKGVVEAATQAAGILASIIEKQKLFSVIQGRRYVKCEGWTTLAAMLGCTPHEVTVVEQPEGVFTATVELRRIGDGQPVARASAECGAPDETDRSGKPIWADRPRYARRSMALTRATAKACRLAFSWVMVLAGFQPTPEEEIPQTERGGNSPAPSRGRSNAVPSPEGSAARATSAPAAPTAPLTQEPLTEAPLSLLHQPDPLKGEELDAPVWPYGQEDKGKLLSSFTSEQLLLKRKWLVKKARNPDEFRELVDAIDTTLAARGGE